MVTRINGFVVGWDQNPQRGKIWKVRVKDPTSQYNDQKFEVADADTSGLAAGLDVTFITGTFKGVRKAYNVEPA